MVQLEKKEQQACLENMPWQEQSVDSNRSAHAIIRLSLTHFRNYPLLELCADTRPVVLSGHNGAGKTNLLEAISLLAPGRGFRKAMLNELSHRAANLPWAVAATIVDGPNEYTVGTGLAFSPPTALASGSSVEEGNILDKRIIKIDGRQIRGHAALARHCHILWLTPQMDNLFLEGSAARRRFLDKLTSGFEPDHAGHVAAYEQAMRERNRLLQEGARYTQAQQEIWLSALERKMAELAVRVAISRLQAVEKLNHVIGLADGAFPKAVLALSGFVESEIESNSPALQIESRLQEGFERSRGGDAAAGRTLEGAHRTLWNITYLEKRMEASQCSTGEQKALLLSILLAQARALKEWRGRMPILLLDEVAAHLDVHRRAALFEEITALGVQAWLTGTDAGLFEGLQKNAQFFAVKNSTVQAS